MNQILQTENKKDNKQIEIGKIVKFFAIAIIIFAIISLGIGIYYILTNNNTPSQTEEKKEIKPNVNIEKQGENIVIEIKGEIAISKILYKWNEEEEKTIECENNTNISKTIELPYGTNTLNLTVIDINGEQTKFQKEYIVDEQKPNIELTVTTDYKIKILVQDKLDLKNIYYSWNNDEKIKINVNSGDKKKIEQIIEIPLGQNTLKVEATNIDEVTSTKELEIRGVKRPNLTFKKQGDNLIIKAEDEVGIKIIEYTLNGQTYQLDYGNKKVIEYTQALPKGESNMEIRAENKDGGITTKKVQIINN